MRAMLLQLCVFLAAGVAYPGEEKNKPAASASQGTYQVQLTDGTVIQILSYRIQGNYVAFVTKDGANVAFRRGDIDLDTLPTETEPIPQDGPPPDSLGARRAFAR
jgi:hypothetical protein